MSEDNWRKGLYCKKKGKAMKQGRELNEKAIDGENNREVVKRVTSKYNGKRTLGREKRRIMRKGGNKNWKQGEKRRIWRKISWLRRNAKRWRKLFLLSFFNGISIFLSYLMPKPSLLKNNSDTIYPPPDSWIRDFIPFLRLFVRKWTYQRE